MCACRQCACTLQLVQEAEVASKVYMSILITVCIVAALSALPTHHDWPGPSCHVLVPAAILAVSSGWNHSYTLCDCAVLCHALTLCARCYIVSSLTLHWCSSCGCISLHYDSQLALVRVGVALELAARRWAPTSLLLHTLETARCVHLHLIQHCRHIFWRCCSC
jgi:hypothetical protein